MFLAWKDPLQYYGGLVRDYSWYSIKHNKEFRSRLRGNGWRSTGYSARVSDAARTKLGAALLNSQPSKDELYATTVLPEEPDRFILKNGKIVRGKTSDVHVYHYDKLASALSLTQDSKCTVLEVGCGHGRNLFWLKSNYPELHLCGLDISPVSIDLCKSLSGRLGLQIEFSPISDHLLPIADDSFDIVFTYHCIEQCPYTYKEVIQELLRVTKRRVVLFEPMVELQGRSLRGLANRHHAFHNNYPTRVYSHLKTVANIRSQQPTGWASNPAWETCLVVIDKE